MEAVSCFAGPVTRTPQGTNAPMEMIEAMREFLKASKLGLFEALDELRQKIFRFAPHFVGASVSTVFGLKRKKKSSPVVPQTRIGNPGFLNFVRHNF